MTSNLITALSLITIVALLLYWQFVSKPNRDKSPPNTLVKRRQKRGLPVEKELSMPDAAKAHEHEKKVKSKSLVEVPNDFHQLQLIQEIDPETQDLIKKSLKTIRKPHPLLQTLTSNISDPKKLHDTIRTDPELVAKIINVANSPLFGLSKPITNVSHAVIYLGIVQVKNIATHFALQESMEFGNKKQQLAYERIWSAGFLASSIAQLFAQELGLENIAELATRCQLSYLGDISSIFAEPDTANLYLGGVSLVHRINTTQKLIGTNNAVLGKLLAIQWNLPKEIHEAIHLGLVPFINELDYSQLSQVQEKEILLCYLSCRLAEILSYDGETDVLEASQLNFEETGRVEFFHFQEQIEHANFNKINTIFANPAIKNKIAQLVGNMNNGPTHR